MVFLVLFYTTFKLYGCSTRNWYVHILVLDFGHWSVRDYVPFRHQIFGPNSVCVCVFFPFILDKFVGHTSRGHTGGRSHRISHLPFFCGACLNFSREKDSAIPFPRRLWSRILFTNDLIVLHPLGIFSFSFSFLVRKIPFAGIELTSQRVRGLRGTSELPGRPAYQ